MLELNKKLNNTRVELYEEIITVNLIKEGWITEIFLIIKSIEKKKNIKGVFQVYEEEKMIIKEKIETRKEITEMNYKEFIGAITENSNNDTIGSGKINWKKVKKIEIRLNKKIKDVKDIGFNEQNYNILIKEIYENSIQ